MKQLVIIIFSLIFSSVMIIAQESDCMEQVKKTYAKSSDFDKNALGDKAYAMNMSITTTPNKSLEAEPYTANIEYMVSKDLVIFKTEGIKVYEGKNETVTVIDLSRTILIANTPKKDYKKRQDRINILKDSIFQYSNVTECKKIRLKNGMELKKIKMNVSEKGQKSLFVKNIVFYLDMEKESVYLYKMFFTDGYEIDNIKVVFNKLDRDYKSPELAKSARYFIFHNNALKPEYKGYELIDKRKSN